MLPFHNSLTNDNPISDDLDLESLRHWYYALPLILSNLFGIFAVIYAKQLGFFVVSMAVLVAIVFSFLYHMCQTTEICFGYNLENLTFADHLSAPALFLVLLLFISNSRSTEQLSQVYIKYNKSKEKVTTKYNTYIGNIDNFFGIKNDSDDKEKSIEENKKINDILIPIEKEESITYYDPNTTPEENMIYDFFSVFTLYVGLFIVILAAIAHPFNFQAFIIVAVYALCVIFFKIVIMDAGNPLNMKDRFFLPDLILGIVLISLSLICFVLDSWFYYPILHSLWHLLSFLGIPFFLGGLTKNTPYWYSPFYYSYYGMGKCCCFLFDEEDYTMRKKEIV